MNIMKPGYFIVKIFFILTFLIGLTSVTEAQRNCPTSNKDILKLYGNLPLANFDYRGQSSNAVLMQGDTVDYEVVLYAYKDYRVIVVAEPQLGEIKFKIYEKKKETLKKIKEIKKTDPDPVYKRDQYGEILYDDNWEPVIDTSVEQEPTYDTIWERKLVKREYLLFENESKDFWDLKKVRETKNFRIQVMVPYSENLPEDADIYDLSGCVNILVGHKPEEEDKQFKRY